MKSKGARLTTEISLPGRFVVFVPSGEGLGVSRRLEDEERNRLRDILKKLDLSAGRRHRPHRRRRRDRRGHRARPRVPAAPLGFEIQKHEKDQGAPGARVPGVRAAASGRPRSLHRRFRASADRRRRDVQAHHRLPEEDLAAHGRASGRDREKEPLFERFGVDREIRSTLSRRVDLPSGGYLIFDYAEAFTVIDVNTGRFTGSRSSSSGSKARGHDHEEQPRGGEGGRPPAAPARHRRDHRHRLHRHGEPEEPGPGGGGAAHRARAGPDEDIRRRDLAARPRRDDAPERHRRAARDPHDALHGVRRRRRAHLGGDRCDRDRAQAARARPPVA